MYIHILNIICNDKRNLRILINVLLWDNKYLYFRLEKSIHNLSKDFLLLRPMNLMRNTALRLEHEMSRLILQALPLNLINQNVDNKMIQTSFCLFYHKKHLNLLFQKQHLQK